MKNTLSIGAIAIALVSTANAKGFNGIYAGVDVGMSSMNTHFRATSTDPILNPPLKASFHGNTNRPNLGIFLGYNKVFSNCFTLGGVLTADFNLTGKKTLENNHLYKFEQKRRNASWGLLATVGALVNPQSMVFIGLGIKSLKNSYTLTDFEHPATGIAKFKNNKIKFTTQIGHEALIVSNSIALRITYGFTPNASKNISITNTQINFFSNGFPGYAKIKSNEHLVKLGCSYRF